MNKLTLLLFYIGILCMPAFSQTAKSKAAKSYFEHLSYSLAAPIYTDLVETDPTNIEYKRNLAICHYNLGEPEESAKYFEQIINTPEAGINDYFLFSQVLKQTGKIQESNLWLEKMNALNQKDLRGLSYVNNKNYLEHINQHSNHISIKSLGINTEACEFGGYRIFGQNAVLIVSNRQNNPMIQNHWTWDGSAFLDYYTATIHAKDSLENPRLKNNKINSRFHEGPICYSIDGKTIYITRNNLSAKKNRRDINGIQNLKLYAADVQTDGSWNNERELQFNSEAYSTGHPTSSVDGKHLYFSSDMPGGFGGSDIYFVTINEDGSFGKPINLGPEINTEANEMFPSISPDGLLYFSSNGHVGLGGLDIFVSFPKKDGFFRKVTHTGNQINSSRDDFAMTFNPEGLTGFFSSNRLSGKGNDDVYAFEIIKPFKSGIQLSGNVTDSKTGQPLENSLVAIFNEEGIIIDSIRTDKLGNYTYEFENPQKILIHASNSTYLDQSKSINITEDDNELRVDIALNKKPDIMLICKIEDGTTKLPLNQVSVKIKPTKGKTDLIASKTDSTGVLWKEITDKKIGEQVSYTITLEKFGYLSKVVTYTGVIPEDGYLNLNERLDLALDQVAVGTDLSKIIDIKPIYFDLGKWDIRKDAAIELDKIVKVMNDNPTMVVELGSHTDCRSSIKFNLDLSSKRATASANYIKKRITKPERIYGKGYGESKLILNCPCEGAVKSTCSEEDHQKNRRTEFVIMKM